MSGSFQISLIVDRVMSVTFKSFGGPGTSESSKNYSQKSKPSEQRGQHKTWNSNKQHGRTEDVDSDIDVFLSRFILGSDGVASRVAPQADGDGHNGRGVSGLHLK